MRYICCQPATDYFLWQVETAIVNFKNMGINPNMVDIVCSTDGNTPEKWQRLANHHNTIRFFFYKDTQTDKSYIPSIYFHLMSKHIEREDVKSEVLFLHDSDIVFTRTPDFSEYEKGNKWYMSDCNSYINYDYIMSKGQRVYDDMCRILRLDPLIPKLLNSHGGGAQYIVKNTTPEFWSEIERDSIVLYRHFCETEHMHIKKNDFDYPIQKWTAGMWSFLWGAWRHGYETQVDKGLSFGWATNDISEVTKHTILHNAGVVDKIEHANLFNKLKYIHELPYNKNLEVDPTKASWYYFEQVKNAAKQTIL